MKGDPKVIEFLNRVLRNELTAINQYFVHAKMCEDWGYMKLAAYTKKEAIEEMQHAGKRASWSPTSTSQPPDWPSSSCK